MKNSINDLTSDQKSLMAFTLLLSDPAFQAWMGEAAITPELIVKICEKFPGMAATSHL